jgi:hypothetical protein
MLVASSKMAGNVRGFVQVWNLKNIQPALKPNCCLLLKDKFFVD